MNIAYRIYRGIRGKLAQAAILIFACAALVPTLVVLKRFFFPMWRFLFSG